MNVSEIVARQREYFYTGETRPAKFRKEALLKLRNALIDNESLILEALKKDLNKHPMETFMTETGLVLEEIRYHIKHLDGWMRNRTVKTPVAQFHAKSYVAPEPYGVTLIMSPWNYPLQLCLSPLVGAISGGNCAVVKPSAYAPETSHVIARLLGGAFDPKYIAAIEGGREQNSALLDETFDYIFFTGSVAVGKAVMASASKNLTPVTLELGGKSPVIIDETADIKIAARRIAFGKVINAGQTCVGPDYIFIHESVRDKFISEFKAALSEFFPDGDMSNMPVIISDKHYRRVKGLLENQNAVLGGGTDDKRRFIEPTLLIDVAPDSPVMSEEIFAPILPIMTFKEIDTCITFIRSRPKPLALYLFTGREEVEKRILNTCSFGGGCINDTLIHLATLNMGFGGVGYSGMGSYHGKKSFETFTHDRSIVKKSTWIDLKMRYHPYSDRKLKIIQRFMK